MSVINLVLFKFDQESEMYKDIITTYENNSQYKVISGDDYQRLSKFISKNTNAIFMFCVNTKKDLQEAVFIIKEQRKMQHHNLLKTICCLSLNFDKNEKILKSYGVLDFFTPDEKVGQVHRKIEMMTGKLIMKLTEVEKYEDYAQKVKETLLSDGELLKDQIRYVPAIDLESDVWIVKSKQDYKIVMRKWLLHILGPSTHIGKWIEVKSDSSEQCWKFDIVDHNDADFISDKGEWYFEGDKPTFDWKISRWVFSSAEPKLYFKDSDKNKSYKINFEDNHILIAKNSDHSIAKEELLEVASNVSLDVNGLQKAKENYRGYKAKLDEKKKNQDEFEALVGKGNFGDTVDSSLKGKTSFTENEGTNKFVISDTDKLDANMSGHTHGADNIDTSYSGDTLGDEAEGDNYSGTIDGEKYESEDPVVLNELNTESGEVSVELQYDPNKDNSNLNCEFEDIFENELVVLVPKDSVLLNENVTAEVVLKYNGQEANISCRGRIIEIEVLDETKETLIIDLSKMSKEKYMSFMKLFQERQDNIVDFMVRARGH